MATNITIAKTIVFKEPKWSVAQAKPGQKVELSVNAKDLLPGQTIHFIVRSNNGPVLSHLDAKPDHKQQWITPNTPEESKYHFYAVLREKPSVANGHMTVEHRLKSDDLTVKGTRVTIISIDGAFVPKQEKLEVKYKIEGEVPAKGRIEIWGERFPTSKPIYTETFVPAAGEKTWNTWHGGKDPSGATGAITNAPLDNKYLTPEFSPYRLRIITGPDDDTVQDPLEKGLGKVAMIESQFEVKFESIRIRLQKGLNEAAGEDKYKMKSVLAIEKAPPSVDGTYKTMGRLPKVGEQGRIRIPMARHINSGECLDQGTNNLGNGFAYNITADYMGEDYGPLPNNPGKTKYLIDQDYYTRPEIPLEFELRLTSRVSEKNAEDAGGGLFEAEAIGPVKIEPVAEDNFILDLFQGGNANDQEYWRNATFMIKRGVHDSPQNSGNNPIYSYWQARFRVPDNATRQFAVNLNPNADRITDPKFKWTANQAGTELKVYLNRKRLYIGTDDEFDKGQKDFKELNDHEIELRENLAKENDILWIVRKDHTLDGAGAPDEVAGWTNFPPGTNCHKHYGGLRGDGPNNLWAKDWSGAPGGNHEPIIGKSADDYPYKDKKYINLKPDPVTDPDQERVEIQAIMENGDQKGLAGIIFSPSYIAGDSYVLKARLAGSPYERSFVVIGERPWKEVKTGALTVWRLIGIEKSLRLPDRGGVAGMDAAVGSQPDPNMSTRGHPADGFNMSFTEINRMVNKAFNEWTISLPVPVIHATRANPVVVTAPSHGLTSGDCIKIYDVKTAGGVDIPEFNGTFVAKRIDDHQISLHTQFDFAQADGVGAGKNGTGAAEEVDVAVAITAVTKADDDSPIKVTAAGHGLANDNDVLMIGVQGGNDANGRFKVTMDPDDANCFTLNDTQEAAPGPYTVNNQSKVISLARCGKIDVHRGVNLKAYKTAYDTAFNALGLVGKVPLTGPDKVKNEMAPWDHYRDRLPPGIPGNRINVATNTINGLAVGTSSTDAFVAVHAAIIGHGVGGDAALGVGGAAVPAPPMGWVANAQNYSTWVDEQAESIFYRILDALTPKVNNPKKMNAVRWPLLRQSPVWTNYLPATPGSWDQFNRMVTNGMCVGSGQSFYQSGNNQPGLFEHEEQHSVHLVHFVAGNFGWKHHDLRSSNCLMSYTWPNRLIIAPDPHVGTDGDAINDGGWPHTVPNPLPSNPGYAFNRNPANLGDPSINYLEPHVPGDPCAKCILKLRGWKEDVLPCAWNHPDLF